MPSSPIEILLPNRPAREPGPAPVTDGEHRSLLVALAAVPDPRDPRGKRYPLVSMLAVAVCAVLAGACTFAAITDWVRDLDRPAWGRLGFADRAPAATTVWRLLIRIDAEALQAVLSRWLRSRAARPLGWSWPRCRSRRSPTKSRRSRRCWTGWSPSWAPWTVCWSWPTRCTPRPATPRPSPPGADT